MATAIHTHVPRMRYTGERYRDIEKCVEASSRHEAFVLFESAKKRLNDVNNWQLLCGKTPADFRLTDAEGNLLRQDAPKTGDLIRVRRYADGKDRFAWYRIEAFIHEKNLLKDTEDFGFIVKQVDVPSALPEASDSGVTCLFVVTRSGCKVSAVEAERFRVSADGQAPVLSRFKDKIQSAFSWINSSNQQWKSLINGMLQC